MNATAGIVEVTRAAQSAWCSAAAEVHRAEARQAHSNTTAAAVRLERAVAVCDATWSTLQACRDLREAITGVRYGDVTVPASVLTA